MPEVQGPILEFSYAVDPETVEEFDAWLSDHVDSMRAVDGVTDARSFVGEPNEAGWPLRVARFRFEDKLSLENYLGLENYLAVPPGGAADAFGELVSESKRVLRESGMTAGTPRESCLNCGSPLAGQYCGRCGQRANSRLISLWELLRDAFGDLFELDSRLWRTLVPLMIRPGRLTRDYLEGRRARFMPPFRTYLVLSILFFLAAFFDPREQFSVFFEEQAVPAVESADSPTAEEIRQEIMQELAAEGVLAAPPAEPESPPAPGAETGEQAEPDPGSGGFNIRITDGGAETDSRCDQLEVENMPPWLEKRLTPERLKLICERTTADGGAAFLSRLLDNTPAALIFLLPLMALILKILYPLSKRYYVEHLLFVVHYHAFVFLILTLQTVLNRLVAAIGLPEALASAGAAAVFFYVPAYLYKALRRVYDQGHLLSSLKFAILFVSYLLGLTLIFSITLLISAFSM